MAMNELAVDVNWLREQLHRDERIFFIEIRHAGDRDMALMKARGALRLTQDDAPRYLPEIPREGTVVVYSSAPGDEPAQAMVRLCESHGMRNAKFLKGGFRAYLSAGLPVENIGEGRNMTRVRRV
jgi:rhodanese-related sulfurtransferase